MSTKKEIKRLEKEHQKRIKELKLRKRIEEYKKPVRLNPDLTKHLVKEFLKCRLRNSELQLEQDVLHEKIAENANAMDEIQTTLRELNPDSCEHCGIPIDSCYSACQDYFDYNRPLSYAGNRVWWNVDFTPEETAQLSDGEEYFDIIEAKAQQVPFSTQHPEFSDQE